ncbi:glutamine hydrolyzing CTP synthase [Nanoarchaeota archaeon]
MSEKITKDAAERLRILQSFADTKKGKKWSSFPKGYKLGKVKYIIITGGVISGVGKGITGGSMGTILQEEYGFNCTPIKMESYYNIDSGLLSPFEHGEVFVLDDGTETDMDLGSYESFYSKNLTKWSFFTNGNLEESVRGLERDGSFEGKTVQFYPHKVGLVNKFMRKSAMVNKADIMIIEFGGKVGDEESRVYFKALERFVYEEGRENVFIIHNVYMPKPNHLREQKTWPVQQAITDLVQITSLKPDIVAVRSHELMAKSAGSKIQERCMLGRDSVISLPDQESIYLVPLILKNNKVDIKVLKHFNLRKKLFGKKKLKQWQNYVKNFLSPKKTITIGITGKYGEGNRDVYASIIKAIEHASTYFNVKANVELIDTERIESGEVNINRELEELDGIIIPGGFGQRGTKGKIMCAGYARKNKVPYLGLCYGFQMAIIEFGRNVCNLKEANTEENVPGLKHPVICLLPEQYEKQGLGGNMRLGGKDVMIIKGTKTYKIFGDKTKVRMRFRHRYEFNPKYKKVYEDHGLVFSGMTPDKEIMQIFELEGHPFYVGTQAHPEFSSKPLSPHPLYLSFINAAIKNS